jgi:hypothetical protein
MELFKHGGELVTHGHSPKLHRMDILKEIKGVRKRKGLLRGIWWVRA